MRALQSSLCGEILLLQQPEHAAAHQLELGPPFLS